MSSGDLADFVKNDAENGSVTTFGIDRRVPQVHHMSNSEVARKSRELKEEKPPPSPPKRRPK